MNKAGNRISLLIYTEAVNPFFTEFYSDAEFRARLINAKDYCTAIFIGNYFDAVLVDATSGDWQPKRRFINIVNSIAPWTPVMVVAPGNMAEAGEMGTRAGITAMVSEDIDYIRLKEVMFREIRMRQEAIDRTFVVPENFNRYNRILDFFSSGLAGDDTEQIMCSFARRITEEFPAMITTFLEANHANTYYCCSTDRISEGFIISLKSRVLNLFNDMTIHPPARAEGILNRVESINDEDTANELFHYLCSVPVLEDDRLTGLLTIAANNSHPECSETDIIIIFSLMRQLCLLLSSFNKIRSRMIHDALTGLYDHQYFQRSLRLQFETAQEKDRLLSLLLLDIDRFKNFNDSYGHFIGDEVLKDFAALLSGTCRRQDLAARFGGDEFAVIIPGSSRDDVRRQAQALLEKIRNHVFKTCGHPLSFTVSIGMASSKDPGIATAAALFEAADAALYLSKKNGRNQLCCNFEMCQGRSAVGEAARIIGNAFRKAFEGGGTAEEGGAAKESSKTEANRKRGRILLVDDNQDILTMLRNLLTLKKFETVAATTGLQALDIVRAGPENIDLIISDINMPEMDGLALLQSVRNLDPNLDVILLTGFATVNNSMSALKAGAFRIIRKPFDMEELINAVENGVEHCSLKRRLDAYHVHLEEMLQQKTKALQLAVEQLKTSLVRTMTAVVSILDAHEQNTATHSQVVSMLAVRLAESMGIDGREELNNIRYGALLHDLGKLAIPTTILNKPAKLNEEEMEIIRSHPRKGYEIAKIIPFLEEASEIIYQHHERFDGTGYPRKLKGEEICIGARIFSVVDTFEAMRSSLRVYKEAVPLAEVVREINRCSGSQFDPLVVKAFNNCCDGLDTIFQKYHRQAFDGEIPELTQFIGQPLD